MRIFFYQWEAFMQKDMEIALRNMGIDFTVYRYPFKEKNDPAHLKSEVKKQLSNSGFDAVLSFNYREELAVCAYEAKIPYMAWIVDSPFGVTQDEEILRLPTNHIFIFDRYDYDKLVKRGIKTVYHHMLAVNVPRLDELMLSAEDHGRFDADIAFVGSMYPSTFPGFRSRITEEEATFVENVIASQMKVQGQYLLDELTDDDDMLKNLQITLEGEYHGYDRLFHEGLQSILAKETTRRDRLVLVSLLSEYYDVALYSNRSEPMITQASERGIVESFEELFKVYKATKINLCIGYRRIASGIPLRALEVMGAGGFLLSNRQPEIEENFTDGADCVMYDSIEDAFSKVQYYLEHEKERQEIAANGHEKAKEFTYEKQFQKMLDIVFNSCQAG